MADWWNTPQINNQDNSFWDTVQTVPDTAAPQEQKTVLGEFGSGLTRGYEQMAGGLGGAIRGAGDALGLPAISDIGKTTSDYWNKAAEENVSTAPRIEDVKSVGDLARFGARATGELVPQVIASTAAAATGLGLPGVLAHTASQEFGSIYNDQPENRKDLGRAALAAAPAAALDFLPTAHLLKRTGVLNALTALPVRAGLHPESVIKAVLKSAGVQTLEEVPTETLQTAFERFGAFKPLWDAEAKSEYLNTAASVAMGAGAPAGVIGGVGAHIRNSGIQQAPHDEMAAAINQPLPSHDINQPVLGLPYNPVPTDNLPATVAPPVQTVEGQVVSNGMEIQRLLNAPSPIIEGEIVPQPQIGYTGDVRYGDGFITAPSPPRQQLGLPAPVTTVSPDGTAITPDQMRDIIQPGLVTPGMTAAELRSSRARVKERSVQPSESGISVTTGPPLQNNLLTPPSTTDTLPEKTLGEGVMQKDLFTGPVASREPWEMTRTEYGESLRGLSRKEPEFAKILFHNHTSDVKNAIIEGKPVPAEVLAEYPELQRTARINEVKSKISQLSATTSEEYAAKMKGASRAADLARLKDDLEALESGSDERVTKQNQRVTKRELISNENELLAAATPPVADIPLTASETKEINGLLRNKKAAIQAGNDDVVDTLDDKIEAFHARVSDKQQVATPKPLEDLTDEEIAALPVGEYKPPVNAELQALIAEPPSEPQADHTALLDTLAHPKSKGQSADREGINALYKAGLITAPLRGKVELTDAGRAEIDRRALKLLADTGKISAVNQTYGMTYAKGMRDRGLIPAEPTRRPLRMDGTTRPVKPTTPPPAPLPARSVTLFQTALADRDTAKLKEMIHPDNKTWRKMFEEATGEKLPAGVSRSEAVVDKWAEAGGIGREWDSPYGRQRLVKIDTTGPSPMYVAQTVGTDTIRNYMDIEKTIKEDQRRLTPEYAAEVADRKETARLTEERNARTAERAKQADAEIKQFTDHAGLSDMAAGKARAALTARQKFNGVETSRKEAIEKMVTEGYTIGDWKGERTLVDKEGAFFSQSQITKTGLDYAAWLIDGKPAPVTVSDHLEAARDKLSTIKTTREAQELDDTFSKLADAVRKIDTNVGYKLMKRAEEGVYEAAAENSGAKGFGKPYKVAELHDTIDEAVKLLADKETGNESIRRGLQSNEADGNGIGSETDTDREPRNGLRLPGSSSIPPSISNLSETYKRDVADNTASTIPPSADDTGSQRVGDTGGSSVSGETDTGTKSDERSDRNTGVLESDTGGRNKYSLGQGDVDQSGLKGDTITESGEFTHQEKAILLAASKDTKTNLIPVEVTGEKSDALRSIADAFSMHITFFTDAKHTVNPNTGMLTAPNGLVSEDRPNTIFINTEAGNHTSFILGHELSHLLELATPDQYKQVLDDISLYLDPAKYKLFNERMKQQPLYNELTDKGRYKEFVGDLFGETFTDERVWNALAKEEPTLFRKIARAFYKLIDKLNRIFIPADNAGSVVIDLEAVKGIIADAVRVYAKEHGSTTSAMDGIIKYSMSTPRTATTSASLTDSFNRLKAAERESGFLAGAKHAYDAVANAFNPTRNNLQSHLDRFFKMKGAPEEVQHRLQGQLADTQKAIQRRPVSERVKSLDIIRTSTSEAEARRRLEELNPVYTKAFDVIAKENPELLDRIRQYTSEDFGKDSGHWGFGVQWEKVPGAKEGSDQFFSVHGRSLEGNKGWTKQQTLKTVSEGIEKGGKLATDNLVDVALNYRRNAEKFIEAQKAMEEWNSDGTNKYITDPRNVPEGYVSYSDRITNVFKKILQPDSIHASEHVDKAQYEGLMKIARNLGIDPERVLKLKGGALGVFFPGNIKTLHNSYLSVLAHEIGHAIDLNDGGARLWDGIITDAKGVGETKSANQRMRSTLKKELRNIADLHAGENATPSRKKYTRKRVEQIAQMVQAYVHAPDLMKETAPTVYKAFDAFIKADPKLADMAKIQPGMQPTSLGYEQKIPEPIYVKSYNVMDGEGNVLGQFPQKEMAQNSMERLGGERVAIQIGKPKTSVQAGEWYGPENLVRMVDNYTSRDAIRSVPIGRALMGIKNFTTATELALSGFHYTTIGSELVSSTTGLALRKALSGDFKGAAHDLVHIGDAWNIAKMQEEYVKDPATFMADSAKVAQFQKYLGKGTDVGEVLHAAFEGGWKAKQNYETKSEAIKSLRDKINDPNSPMSKLNMPLEHLESMQNYLFDVYVPRLKFGMFAKEYQFNKQQWADRGMTDTEVARKTMQFIEDRFGEMNWDNLNLNRTFKTALMGTFRSFTWKLGNLRGLGGALPEQYRELSSAYKRALDKGDGKFEWRNFDGKLSPKASWALSLIAVNGMMAALTMTALTGEPPDELIDWVFPHASKRDPKARLAMPTYIKEAFSLGHSAMKGKFFLPTEYVTASTSSMWGKAADVWRNKDYYGQEIRHAGDNPIQQAGQILGHLSPVGMAYGVLPYPKTFSLESAKKMSESGEGATSLISLAGINKAPSWIEESAALRKAMDYTSERMGQSARTSSEIEHSRLVRKLAGAVRMGEGKQEIATALQEGKISQADIHKIRTMATQGQLARSFKGLDVSDALDVWELATDKERKEILPLMHSKINRSHTKPAEERKSILQRWQEIR